MTRKMTIDLSMGKVGVKIASQREAVEAAHYYGFESVEPIPSSLAKLTDQEWNDLKSQMSSLKVQFGAGGMPVQFREDEAKYKSDLATLPKTADMLKRAGVTRVGTYIKPSHKELTYSANMKQHVARLKPIAEVLKERGIRLGLEYVGPRTSLLAERFPFIHTLAETKDLIAEIGTGNVGIVLDSWHWYHAGETKQDLLKLKNEEVVAVDLNDAPKGVAKEQMNDLIRELPCATGIIPVGEFLGALVQIGYDGPVRAEPFKKELGLMPKEDALSQTAEAMRKAFELAK